MQEIVLELEYLKGVIKRDIVDDKDRWKGFHSTGIDALDNDELIWWINDRIAILYRSSNFFTEMDNLSEKDLKKQEELKLLLEKHLSMLINRLEELNDGSFVVVSKLPLHITISKVSKEEYDKYILDLKEWINGVKIYSSYSMYLQEEE